MYAETADPRMIEEPTEALPPVVYSPEPPKPFGPDYNITSGKLAKFRFNARSGLNAMDREARRAYADEVEKVVLARQRSEFMRASVEPGHSPNCASGTWHTSGDAIDRAVKEQQRNALLACPGQIRRARTPKQWEEMYEEAMKEKRERENQVLTTGKPT